MDIANLVIRVTNQGLRETTRDLDRLGGNSRTVTRDTDRLRQSVGLLKTAFAGLFASIGFGSILRTADAMQSLNSRIKLVTNSTEEYLAVRGRLRDMANNNNTEYDALVNVYSDSRRALVQLGKTQNETLLFTDNLTKAMFVGGGAASAQAGALRQLGQALASGVLRGDEFNSIAEQAPILLQLLSKELGVSQGALRAMSKEGLLTSKYIYDAVSKATDELTAMVAKMPTTMGQALEIVKNNYKYFIDDMLNDTTGLSGAIASGITFIGRNLESLIPILVAVVAAWGAYALATSTAVTTSVAAAVTSMTSMGYAFLSNTALMKAQILSYFELNAMIARYSTNMMIAKLTLANYRDIVITTALSIQAKVKAMQSSIAANIADAATILRNGEATFRLGLVTIGATIAIVNKVNAMRSGVTVGSAYTAVLTGVAGVAAVATTAVTTLAGAIARLGGIINAHPIMFLAVTLLSVVAATEDAEGKTRGFTGAMESLSEAVKVVGTLFLDFVRFAIDGISSVGRVFGTFITSFVQNSQSGVNESSNMFAVFFSNTEGGFVGLLQVFARFSDLAAASIRNLIKSIVRGMSNLVKDVANKAATMGNVLVDAFEWAAGGIAKTLNFISGGVGWAVKQLNKISPIQIGIEERDYAAPKLKRFLADRALDVQGWSESMMPIMEDQIANGLSGTVQRAIDATRIAAQEAKADLDLVADGIANIADAEDKKKKKAKKEKKPKVVKDEAAEAYKKLLESYNEQMTSYEREAFELQSPFPTEIRKMVFELENPFGKFVGLSHDLKQNLADAAKEMDQMRMAVVANKMARDLTKEFELLGETNPVKQMMYDFDDLSNALSTIDGKMKLEILDLVSAIDFKKHALDIASMNKEIDRQIELSTTTNELDRKRLEIGYEHNDILSKFAYLQDVGHQAAYDSLKVDLDRLKAAKDLLAVNAAKKESRESLQGMLSGLEAESPLGKIQAEYEARNAIIEKYEQTHTDMVNVANEARLASDQAYMDAKRDLMLSQGEAIFGNLAGLSKAFLGDQSSLYKGLFAIEKGYTLATVLLKNKEAIAKAWASAPFPYNIPAVATTVAGTAGLASAVSGIMPQGFKQGGYTGNMGASQVAGVVHGQEYVFDAQSTKRIGVDNLNAMRSGKAPAGGDVSINIINNSSARVEASEDGRTITITDVRNEARSAAKTAFANLQNPNSYESKQINRNVQAPRRR